MARRGYRPRRNPDDVIDDDDFGPSPDPLNPVFMDNPAPVAPDRRPERFRKATVQRQVQHVTAPPDAPTTLPGVQPEPERRTAPRPEQLDHRASKRTSARLVRTISRERPKVETPWDCKPRPSGRKKGGSGKGKRRFVPWC